ncbi:AMP-binding protein, partial [Streptomyces sp. NPDC057052]|uniref:AMP-binding protein n=1 Tax=Streptomyces sp. NPDC057052 TaxID=3346010 RepID=UPI0036431CCC
MTDTTIHQAVREGPGAPGATALVTGGRSWTYRTLLDAAEQVADRLATGSHSSAAVTAQVSDPAAAAVLTLGCDLAGVPLVHRDPAAPGVPQGPTVHDRRDAAPDTARPLCDDPAMWLGTGAPETAAHGLPARAQIFLTSGSTGTPVGVVRSPSAVLADARRVAAYLGYEPGAPVTVAAPLFHAYGFNYGLLGPLLHGAAPVCVSPRSLPSRLARVVGEHAARTLIALPFHYGLLGQAGPSALPALREGFAPLRAAVAAGAPLGPGVATAVA